MVAEFLHPGGVREWMGDWLTRWCYYPVLGATIYVCCWMLSAWCLVKAFRLEKLWVLWAMIPVLALLASITDLGYWIFCLKAPSYWFGPTVGLLVVSMILLLASRCSHWSCPALVLLVGMPLLGWYATLAAIIVLLMPTWKRSVGQWSMAVGSLLFAAMCVGSYYLHSPHVHWREPLLWYGWHRLQNPEAGSLLLEVPFWVLAVSLLLLPVVSRIQHYKKMQILPVVMCLLALMGSNMLNYRNENFHTELKMLHAMEEGRWNDLLSEINLKNPTREMVMMKDVALAQQGRLGDRAFDYPVGGVRPQMKVDLPIHMAHSAGPYFYYWLGIPIYAYMWCQEDNIEYGLSPFFLKLMCKSALAMGDEVTAERYLRLIRQYPFYRSFSIGEEETASVKRFITRRDVLSTDRGFSETYLLEHLSRESYDTPEAQQIAVHWSILARDPAAFKLALSRYKSLCADPDHLPKYFNEKTFQWYYNKDTGRKTY